MGFNSLTCYYESSSRQQSSGFSSSHWLTSCSGPHPLWNSHSTNPSFHPAAKQSWTNVELNCAIQAGFKKGMSQMNNTFSIPPPTCNNKSCFPFTAMEMAIRLVSVSHTQHCPLIVELHIIMHIVSHLWPVWAACLNSIRLRIGLDAECAHSWPPSVTLYADGLKMNKNKTKTRSAIWNIFQSTWQDHNKI